MINCHRPRMNTGHGGQMLAGRWNVLISTGNKQGWFEYDYEGQGAADILIRPIRRDHGEKNKAASSRAQGYAGIGIPHECPYYTGWSPGGFHRANHQLERQPL